MMGAIAMSWTLAIAASFLVLSACPRSPDPPLFPNDGCDVDTDTDGDSDTDVDSDTDADTGAAPPPRLVVTDLRNNGWFMGHAETGEVLDRFDLGTVEPDVCLPDYETTYCLVYRSIARQALDGTTEVVFTYSRLDASDGSDAEIGDLYGVYLGVDAATHEIRWGFDELDFSQLGTPYDRCPFDPDDPCATSTELQPGEYRACTMRMPHDQHVIAEGDDAIELWVADTRNYRMLRLELDKGSSCAVVREVIDEHTHADWDIYQSVNSFQRWEDSQGEQLLMSVKGSISWGEGEAQHGGDSRGKILRWRRPHGGDWAQVWEWPPETTVAPSFVNAPHGVDHLTGPDGREWVVFAHSLGLSDRWGDGTGGTVGVIAVEDDVPAYVADLLPAGTEGFHWTRDVTALADGTILATDSGCLSGNDCEHAPSVRVLSLEDIEPASDGQDGVWTADRSRMWLQEAAVLWGPHFEDGRILYSANPVD